MRHTCPHDTRDGCGSNEMWIVTDLSRRAFGMCAAVLYSGRICDNVRRVVFHITISTVSLLTKEKRKR